MFLGTAMVFNLIKLNHLASSLNHNKTFTIYRLHIFKKLTGLYASNKPNTTKICKGTPPNIVQNIVAESKQLTKLFILKVYTSIKLWAFSNVKVTGFPYKPG